MAEGKLRLYVYELRLLILAKPTQGHDDHCTVRINDDEASKYTSVGRVELQPWRRSGYFA
jgi:hypothetical protein